MILTAPVTEFVSCRPLPLFGERLRLVHEAHQPLVAESKGTNSQVDPALAEVSADLFGHSIVGVSGNIDEAGDAGHAFTIMSFSTRWGLNLFVSHPQFF